jgi:hypothetical protein
MTLAQASWATMAFRADVSNGLSRRRFLIPARNSEARGPAHERQSSKRRTRKLRTGSGPGHGSHLLGTIHGLLRDHELFESGVGVP